MVRKARWVVKDFTVFKRISSSGVAVYLPS